jgi:hypothetical protein
MHIKQSHIKEMKCEIKAGIDVVFWNISDMSKIYFTYLSSCTHIPTSTTMVPLLFWLYNSAVVSLKSLQNMNIKGNPNQIIALSPNQ